MRSSLYNHAYTNFKFMKYSMAVRENTPFFTMNLYTVPVPMHAWAATGIAAWVCWFVCLFVCDGIFYSPGCHSTAFTARDHFTEVIPYQEQLNRPIRQESRIVTGCWLTLDPILQSSRSHTSLSLRLQASLLWSQSTVHVSCSCTLLV